MVRKLVLLLACLAVLAPAALAATPKLGHFTGKTSQGMYVSVRTTEPTHTRFFLIRWSAPCGEKSIYRASATLERLKVVNGAFTGKVFYKDKLKQGQNTRVSVKVNGRFTSPTKATGSWYGTVRLFQGTKQTARCQSGRVRWTATLKQG